MASRVYGGPGSGLPSNVQITNAKPSKPVRVHQQISNTKCVQMPYVQYHTGERVFKPITNSKPMNVQQVMTRGCIVDSNKNNMYRNGNGAPFGVHTAETAAGQGINFRSEAAGQILERQSLYISIANGEVTDEEFLIGDGAALLAAKLGIGAPKAGVIIDGTFGAASYTTIQTLTGLVPMDLHRLHLAGYTTLGAASDAVFNNGFIKSAKASVTNNSAVDEEHVVRDQVLPSSVNTNIRITENWRFQINPITAIHLLIPAGEQLVMTFSVVSAIADVFSMRKYSPFV
jgi:hypothetical protein